MGTSILTLVIYGSPYQSHTTKCICVHFWFFFDFRKWNPRFSGGLFLQVTEKRTVEGSENIIHKSSICHGRRCRGLVQPCRIFARYVHWKMLPLKFIYVYMHITYVYIYIYTYIWLLLQVLLLLALIGTAAPAAALENFACENCMFEDDGVTPMTMTASKCCAFTCCSLAICGAAISWYKSSQMWFFSRYRTAYIMNVLEGALSETISSINFTT